MTRPPSLGDLDFEDFAFAEAVADRQVFQTAGPPIQTTVPARTTFVPLHYEAKYAYPLIVWLHDHGQNELSLNRIMPQISLRNFVAVAPRGTSQELSIAGSLPRCGWPQTPDHTEMAESRVSSAVAQAVDRFNIHPDRIFLAGIGDGGTMAMRLALSAATTFAGAISLGGNFPQGHMPLWKLDQVRSLPVMISHLSESETYSMDHVCQDMRLMHAAGIDITIRPYEGGEELLPQMLKDLNAWAMERVTGTPSDHTSDGNLKWVDLN